MIAIIITMMIITKIREVVYYSLLYCGLFPEELKGCHRGTRGTNDLLNEDQHILKETKHKMKKCDYGMDW